MILRRALSPGSETEWQNISSAQVIRLNRVDTAGIKVSGERKRGAFGGAGNDKFFI